MWVSLFIYYQQGCKSRCHSSGHCILMVNHINQFIAVRVSNLMTVLGSFHISLIIVVAAFGALVFDVLYYLVCKAGKR